MKSNFKYFLLALSAAAAIAAVGCQTSVPPIGAYPAPSTAPNYSLVNNFEGNFNSQPSTFTNTNLFELNTTSNVVNSPGTWTAPNNVPTYATENMTIEGPGAAGTAFACHVTGTVTDPGDGVTYPQIVLIGVLDAAPPKQYNAYDGSFWSGVQFYVNIAPDDTTTYRYVNIPTTQEAKSIAFSAGKCVGSTCYNYFGYSLSGLAPGWQKVNVSFSQMTNIATNFQTTPPTFTGMNLQQILALQWVEGRNNVKGTSTADFWVDEVYFF
ncbi:MAG TPA: hypothetical protein VN963_03595 [bacterium]|nr:hypothetical protein [bacterium]